MEYDFVPVQLCSDLGNCRVNWCPRILSNRNSWVVIREIITHFILIYQASLNKSHTIAKLYGHIEQNV